MALIKLLFMLWLLVMITGSIVAVISFVIDVFRWHDKEEMTIITKSAEDSGHISNVIAPEADEVEGGVHDDGRSEYNTSAVSLPWLQS